MSSVFLSHTSKDKQFVRRLAARLQLHGITVWLDEAEIRVGDSLIDKISEGINESNFLAVVLSSASVESKWVKKELNIAITQEILRDDVEVLPILIEDCKIPSFLVDKFYADFRDPDAFSTNFRRLLQAILPRSPQTTNNKQSVLVIYAGGGIGMRPDESGLLAPARPEYIFSQVDWGGFPDIALDYKSTSSPKDSANMSAKDYTEIAALICREYEQYSGFVILHGLDTVAYAASFLTYMLGPVNRPVVITGSRYPIGFEGHRSGERNFRHAVLVAGASLVGEQVITDVVVALDNLIFKGNRFTPNGFNPVWSPFHVGDHDALLSGLILGSSVLPNPNTAKILGDRSCSTCDPQPILDDPGVSCLRCMPGLGAVALAKNIQSFPASVLVVDTERLVYKNPLGEVLDAASSRLEKILVLVESHRGGGFHMGQYSTLRSYMRESGVIVCNNITVVAALVKLSFLRSNLDDPADIRKAFLTEYCGDFIAEPKEAWFSAQGTSRIP